MQDVPNVCELCLDRLRKIVHILPKSGYHKNNTSTDGADNNAHVVLLDHKYLESFFFSRTLHAYFRTSHLLS